MDMRMQQQVLSPGVQDAEKADLCSQMFRIGGDLQQRGGTAAKQCVIELSLVVEAKQVQLVRERKDNVELRDLHQFSLPGGEPALSGLCLALGAVPVAAAVIRDGLMAAAGTGIDVAA